MPATQEVIDGGYCVGCGACAALPGSAHRMELTVQGAYSARIEGVSANAAAVSRVCPFSDEAISEDAIAAVRFPQAKAHPMLGRIQGVYAAQVVEGQFRQRGSSGGMGSWLLDQLLAGGHVDAVVHVAALDAGAGEALFGYRISTTAEEIRSGAKSRYYPVTLADVLTRVREVPGRYAFTGVPCFIKALRLLAAEDETIGSRVAFCIGLVCGHLKSRGFAEFLAWQMGVPPQSLTGFDFRVKVPGQAANHYGAKALGVVDGMPVERIQTMQQLYGHDWGMGLFKLKACDYCDDVVAETADVTVGDAWLPQYVSDERGTNLLIVRHPQLAEIIAGGVARGSIHLEELTPDDAVRSQASGFSHRREGLAYRLWRARERGEWAPTKRVVTLEQAADESFAQRQDARMRVAELSHAALLEAKRAGTLAPFFQLVVPAAEHYRDFSRPLWRRVLVRLRRLLRGDPLVREALRRSQAVRR
ncbi:coenzyme F420 hydrogenase [Pseudothauera lacus]|uniref:Coenzyme F420 hydrogenase n=2 Tax=Pseudothauera lacus TaxID=2136175 RepID=A0A2T4IK18_9RHOO|nr:coenzyme F420 hydrogenase [Pseudothauera lacus]